MSNPSKDSQERSAKAPTRREEEDPGMFGERRMRCQRLQAKSSGPLSSPRRPAPEWPDLLSITSVKEKPRPRREPEPWEEDKDSAAEPHGSIWFDLTWKARSVALSPDRRRASWRNSRYGGFLTSAQHLRKTVYGRFFEVCIEQVDTKWSDGFGIGIGVHPSLSSTLEADIGGFYEAAGSRRQRLHGLWKAFQHEFGTQRRDVRFESCSSERIAARRGFQPTLAVGGKDSAPLSISTKKEQPKKREKRRIKAVDSIHNYYKIGETVMPSSHSGMSVVFAKRVDNGLEVVVKVRAKANSFVDRAEEREWRHNTEFMLNLPETEGIAKLYEVLEDKKGYYVIMEKVAGQDLFETMTGKGLLPVAEVKEVIKQLLQALAELHARNCIHKDLKLENVMFDRTPPINAKVDWSNTGDQSPVKVKLIDFDTVETVQPQTPKKAKDVLGTDQYIAQEAYDGNYSAASDIFAVGVIGYRLLTAKFPFRADIFDDEAGDNWVGSPKMKEIRQKLQNYKIDWNHRVFSLEPQACNLIKAMLASNERERPTAKEALANGWFNETGRRRSMPDLDRAGRVTECRTVSVCSI
ncbi:unnamed protein product [Durusdinium trenchii]|uniref:Protein kinase domain-containing protein n=1 Tax=Durusdinium trenchii TaxID=1381693 RepID=A0ABP0M3M1_9DINO